MNGVGLSVVSALALASFAERLAGRAADYHIDVVPVHPTHMCVAPAVSLQLEIENTH